MRSIKKQNGYKDESKAYLIGVLEEEISGSGWDDGRATVHVLNLIVMSIRNNKESETVVSLNFHLLCDKCKYYISENLELHSIH